MEQQCRHARARSNPWQTEVRFMKDLVRGLPLAKKSVLPAPIHISPSSEHTSKVHEHTNTMVLRVLVDQQSTHAWTPWSFLFVTVHFGSHALPTC